MPHKLRQGDPGDFSPNLWALGQGIGKSSPRSLGRALPREQPAGYPWYPHANSTQKPLPMEASTILELQPGHRIQVTLFNANHCPGAVMFCKNHPLSISVSAVAHRP